MLFGASMAKRRGKKVKAKEFVEHGGKFTG